MVEIRKYTDEELIKEALQYLRSRKWTNYSFLHRCESIEYQVLKAGYPMSPKQRGTLQKVIGKPDSLYEEGRVSIPTKKWVAKTKSGLSKEFPEVLKILPKRPPGK